MEIIKFKKKPGTEVYFIDLFVVVKILKFILNIWRRKISNLFYIIQSVY
jgi:hypothetical protein